MEKILILSTNEKKKYKTIEILDSIKNKNNLIERDLNLLKNSLKSNIGIYEIPPSKTLTPNKNLKMLIFYLNLKTNKEHNLKKILNEFYNFFDKKSICLFFVIKDENGSGFISFDTQVLNNNLIKDILKKYTFISKKMLPKELKECLEFRYVNNTSINEMFEQMCKEVIYFLDEKKQSDENKKIENQFLDWKYFLERERIIKLKKEIEKINKKIKKSFNNQEKIELNREKEEIKNQLKLINIDINK